MADLVIDDMQAGYIELVETVMEHGEPVAPRGQLTHELTNFTFTLTNPMRSLPQGIGRRFNTKIAAVEAAQLIAGTAHPDLMLRASPNFEQFRDGTVFHGAYGPRLRPQIPRVIERLKADTSTRQAVATIWDPALDTYTEGLRDYPCTVALQWLIRDGALDAHTHMRSNDVWLGVAYDVFQFTQLQITIAQVMGLELGAYHHHATSFHMYERDFDATAELHPPTSFDRFVLAPHGVSRASGVDWAYKAAIARQLLTCASAEIELDPLVIDADSLWYWNRLKP